MSSSIHILSLDDDIDFINILKVKLTGPTFTLIATTNPKDFVSMAQSMKFDLILLDRHLSEGHPTGAQLLDLLRHKLNVTTPIIMVSHHDDYKGIQDCLELGADDYVTKPLDDLLLKSKIQYLIKDNSFELDELHIGRVPGPQGAASLNAQTSILEINEIGIRVTSPYFIRKSAYVRMRSSIFKEFSNEYSLPMTVSHSEINPQGGYLMTLEFDPDDKALLQNLKTWLTK